MHLNKIPSSGEIPISVTLTEVNIFLFMPGMEQYTQKMRIKHGHLAVDGHSVLRSGCTDKPQEDIFNLREEAFIICRNFLIFLNILVGRVFSTSLNNEPSVPFVAPMIPKLKHLILVAFASFSIDSAMFIQNLSYS